MQATTSGVDQAELERILAQAVTDQVGLGLGALAGEQRLREIAAQAGFSRFRRATQTPFTMVLEARL